MTAKWLVDAAQAALFLSMLGNSKRLAVIMELIDRELPVGVLAKKVSLSQSALSQHLAKLRSSRLVETRRERQTVYYACRSEAVKKLLRTLQDIYPTK